MVFCPYGDYWRQMRKICVMELLSPKRVQSFRTIREEEVWNLIEFISSSEAEGLAIDFTEKIVSLTNSITVRAVIGKKCKYEKELVSLIQDTFNPSGGFDVPDLFPSLKFLGFLNRNQARIVQNAQNAFETSGNERA
nr:cytochrome p450 [Quercus suber]